MKSELKITPFHNQPLDNAVLYRYVTIDKLLDFLFSGRLPLIRLNLFEDKLEGVTINHLLLNYASDMIAKEVAPWMGETIKHIGFNVNPTKRNNLRRQRELFQENNYASCWYINDHESVAMWQLYSRPDSVAIRIPFKEISDELLALNFELPEIDYLKLRYGSVDYYKFNDLDELSQIIIKEDTQGFIKDLSYQHEKEFRILIETTPYEKPKVERKEFILDEQIEAYIKSSDLNIIHLTLLNFKELPFEIIFHPQSSVWHRENIIKILDKFELHFKTYESSLKDILK